jgi:hypothetical protein
MRLHVFGLRGSNITVLVDGPFYFYIALQTAKSIGLSVLLWLDFFDENSSKNG